MIVFTKIVYQMGIFHTFYHMLFLFILSANYGINFPSVFPL